jgi:hypothetical protein
MNCVELQESLAEVETGGSAEQQAHLKSCAECSALVADLRLISSSAIELRAADEPSPRVWNSIEIALRQEGLIRPQRPNRSLIPTFGSRWGWARWLAPAAAILLLAVGVYVRQHALPEQLARDNAMSRPAVADAVSDSAIAGLNDDDLLQEVSDQTPALRAEYADNLRSANEFIQDAKNDVAAHPDDEDARRSLLAAYQQKAMLFELAMDRSLQ